MEVLHGFEKPKWNGEFRIFMNRSYPWLRFWVPPHGKINLNDGGFLFDPEDEFGRIYNPDVVKFESIKDKKCLILLGEPGIGKSAFLSNERKNIELEIKAAGQGLIWLNLNIYNDLSLLEKKLFGSEKFKQYLESDIILHIYLDSLDECKLSIPTVINYLLSRFKEHHTERLYVRITCRTAAWPVSAETDIDDIWGESNVVVFELAPLRRSDVRVAAEIQSIDADNFVKVVENGGLVPLASRPVTLNLLLSIFKESQSLPAKRTELYYQGCLKLADEISISRKRAGNQGQLSCNQRLEIAAQIALITLFGNYGAIWVGSESDKPKNSLSIDDLYDCLKNRKINDTLLINRQSILEVVDTGLFVSRGNNYMGWAHQTFAEYLASWSLFKIKLNHERILSLLSNPDAGNKVIPQLYETAAWLTELSPDFSNLILKIQPEMLLESDVLIASGTDKSKLVNQLMDLLESSKLFEDRRRFRDRYKKLYHDDLAEQLAPYIEDIAKNENVRILAIDVAVACQLKSLQDILIAIVLDPSENMYIRIAAGYAVNRIADRAIKQKLRPLMLGLGGEDPDDELKGIALRGLWPTDIMAEELFAVLKEPKNPNLVGAYFTFVDKELVNSFTAEHLICALKWIQKQGKISAMDYVIQRFVDAIMLKAWTLLDQPGVLDYFAETAWILLNRYDHIFNNYGNNRRFEGIQQDVEKRHMLVCAIMPFIENPDRGARMLIHEGLLYEDDILWLLELLPIYPDEKSQSVIAHLISWLTHSNIKTTTVNAILEVCGIEAKSRNMILAKTLSWLVNPVLLDSEETNKVRELFKESQKEEKHNLPEDISSLRGDGIEQVLIEIESGKYNEWPKLFYYLSIMEDGTFDWSNNSILKQPGWQRASLSTKRRILMAAAAYLEGASPDLEAIFNSTGSYSLDAMSAYPALFILHSELPEYFEKMSTGLWGKWTPLITIYPFISEDDKEIYALFLQKAYQANPTAVLNAIDKRCAIDLEKHSDFMILDRVQLIWDGRIAEVLLSKLLLPELTIAAFKTLLQLLLKNKEGQAKLFAIDLIEKNLNNSEIDKNKAVMSASLLIQYVAQDVWLQLWPILKSNVEFGRAVISTLVDTTLSGIRPIIELDEFQIAEVYIWLEQQFPESEDPQYKGVHPLSARDNIKTFRNGCISYLQEKGTSASCEALAKIANFFPDKNWLKHVHYEACKITRGATWLPLKPLEIIKFIDYSELRIVRNESELLETIIIALNKIQSRLKGVISEAPLLWEEDANKPKTEIRLAEFITNRLKEELKSNNIIINREVEIRNITGKGVGNRIDILVEAIVTDSKRNVIDKVAVVIEVKGCWNKDLMEAMYSQLKNEYLGDYKIGLYLVGWYYCERWSNEESGKQFCFRVTDGSLVNLKNILDQQASNLSTNDISLNAYVLDITY